MMRREAERASQKMVAEDTTDPVPDPLFVPVFRGAMKVSLHEITKGMAASSVQVESRGWKLFMLLPDCFSPNRRVGRGFAAEG